MTKRIAGSIFVMFCAARFASADISGTLSFTNPSVTVGPTDPIQLFVTLNMDPSSDPIVTDFSGRVTSVSNAQIGANLFGNLNVFDSSGNPTTVDSVNDGFETFLAEGYGCSGTFFGGCGGPGDPGPYKFNFDSSPLSFGGQSINVNLQPGDTKTYLLGTFTPQAGGAPAGTYHLPFAELVMESVDTSVFDASGHNPLVAIIDFADTGNTSGFDATVTGGSVSPEPSFYALTGVALAGLFVIRRRRTN